MTYYQGFLIPVSPDKKADYQKFAEDWSPFFAEFGAQRIVEGWGADVPRGKNTDMFRGVNASEDENVVFSWIQWASEAVCNEAHDAMNQDERMQQPVEMPFDGQRMVFAGFEVLGESGDGDKPGYIQGYLAPVPAGNREAFAEMCAAMRDVAIDCGALRAVDCWSDKIEDGEVTDFKRAVDAQAGEAVAFGFVEWASKQAFEAGSQKMHNHEGMPAPGSDMPLDGMRLIYGGFEVIVDTAQ